MDGGAAKRIAVLAVSGFEAPRVLEIGAGTGALSKALLQTGVALTVLEIDPDMVEILHERGDLGDARIVRADALAFDYASFASEPSAGPTPAAPWVVTGNLPYNVATPLIVQWIRMPDGPARITAMVQKDVADRFVATPNSKAYGSLTLAVAYGYVARRAFTLGPSVFFPRPGVDSAVVTLERRPAPAVDVRDVPFFLKVVRAAFAYRRKTLANSLSLAEHLDRARTQAALQSLGLNPEIRAEQIGLDAFAALANVLAP